MAEQADRVTFGETAYSLDSQGFLFPPRQWDRGFAEGVATQQKIHGGLTVEHWRVIDYLRSKFTGEETVPVVVFACADLGLRLTRFKRLFPTGYFRGACRIAGIGYVFMQATNHWLSYETAPILKARFNLTPQGYLEDFELWDEEFCVEILTEWEMPPTLSERQRKVVDYLRRFYEERADVPTVMETCRETGIDRAEVEELFPDGYRRGACRVAGLPFFG